MKEGEVAGDDVTLSSFIAKRKALRKRDGGGEKKVFERRKKKKKRSEEDDDDGLLVTPSSLDLLKQKLPEDVECREEEDEKFSGDARVEAGTGGKRSRMDVFEYNEDDDVVDFKRTKRGCTDGDGGHNGRSRVLGPKSLEKGGKLDTSCDDKPVRVQGKNGVLKVMIRNKKEVVGGSERLHGHVEVEEYPARILRNRRSVVIQKTKMNPKKASLTQNSKADDELGIEDDDDTSLGLVDVEEPVSRKKGKVKGDSVLPTEVSLSCGYKGNRGANTKKQLLREQIRNMVLKAGWKIDFRLRKGRNYQDAVYTDHSGRDYWSVLNAYYALRKQCAKDEADGMCSAFTPIPEEGLSLLTRRTRKRIERENRMKLKASKRSSNAKETKNKYVTESKNGRRKNNGSVGLNKKVSGKTQKSTRLSNKVGHGNGENMLKKQSSTGRKSKKQNGYALLVRSSNKEEYPDGSGFTPYAGKRTVLSWMIDSGAISLSGKVQYMNKRRTRTLLEGWITRDGIHCGCCSKIVTVSKFEIHAGSKLRQPFQNIYVETGISLFHCQLNAWNSQDESERSGVSLIDISGDDPNDDTCGICGDGGNLICCDGCPSTFHQSCLDIQVLPTGDWHCSNCSCKFCGLSGDNGQGDDIAVSKLHSCNLCEEKYHESCMQQHIPVVDTHTSCITFCGQNCKELVKQLQKLLWVKHELEDGFSWTLIQRSVFDSDKSVQGLSRKAECNSKLAVALTVMDECFFPIIDRRSGINLIRNVVYNCGSNINRLNYSGFYTAVLERGDEIISAASIRIHGTRLAEMPFIGTRHIYRRQGMCRRLLNAIESALCSLKVEKLIIPAISELVHAWTTVFGFNALEESHKQEMRSLNMLVFPGTDMLQKIVLKHDSTEGNLTDNSVMEAVEPQSSQQITATNEGVVHQEQQINNKVIVLQATMKAKSEPHSSVRPDTSASDKDPKHQEHLINNEVSGVQADLEAHDGTDVGPWMRSMLVMDFFNPCSNHKGIKKNELKYFCISCVRSICCYCLPAHLAHQYIQIRRYLHHDVINLKDFHMLFDCSRIQTYFTNGERVFFINPRPIAAKAKRLPCSRECGSCGRVMQDSSLYCSLACKVSVMDSKHHTEVVDECLDAVSTSIIPDTDDSKLTHNSNLNDHKTLEMETEPDEVSPVGSNATPGKNIHFASESIMNDTSEMKTEVAADQPDLYNSEVGYLPCSTSRFTQLHDTSIEENGGRSACHDSENTSQPLSNVSKCSFLDSQDSNLVGKIQGCDLDKSVTVSITYEMETEVSAMGNNPQALSKDSLDCASEGDRKFVSSASRNNCLSSVACVSDELLSNCSKSPSEVALPPVSEAAHDNTSNAAAESCGAVPAHSSHHSSNQASVLDVCKLDAGFSSVYPNDHAFGQASVCDSLDTASEPNVQVMDGTDGFCKSLEKNDQISSCKSDVPGLKDEVAAFGQASVCDSLDTASEPNVQVMDGTDGFCKSLEKNDQTSSCKSNNQDVPGLKDEVAAFESNALDENAIRERSEEAVKSLDKTA